MFHRFLSAAALQPVFRFVLACALLLPAAQLAMSEDLVVISPAQRANARIEVEALSEAHGGTPTGLTLTGRIEPGAGGRTMLVAPAAGRVIELAALPGTVLQRGQRILTLGGPELAALQRAAREARAAATAASQRVERDRALVKEGLIAVSRLEAAEAEHAAARAQLFQLTGAMPGLDFMAARGDLILTAPVAGVLAGPRLAVGAAIATGDTLAIIGVPKELRAALVTSAELARGLSAGDAVIVRGRSCEARGTLRAVGTGVDVNQVVSVDVAITDREACLLPGEAITASIAPQALAEGGWSLPPRSFVRRGAETFVFVEREGGFLAVGVDSDAARAGVARSVTLRAGDRVAITGTALLKGAWIGIAEEE